MTNSGCFAASAGDSCENGDGGAGNKINSEDVLGYWAGVSAYSYACSPCVLACDAPLQSVRGIDGGYDGGCQAGTHVLGVRYTPVRPSQGGGGDFCAPMVVRQST